jgi:hypothetical protein
MNNLKEFKDLLSEYDNNFNEIVVNQIAYKIIRESMDQSFLGKLKWGYRLFLLSYEDWKNLMKNETSSKYFFDYLGNFL